MSIKRLYISKAVMTLTLGGVALISLIGNKEKNKVEPIYQSNSREKTEYDALKNEIEEIKKIELHTQEEIKELSKENKIDYIPFENYKRMEKDIEYIKKKR